MTERRITDGGRALRARFTRDRVSVPTWCERHGFDRIQIQRILNGERWKRISVDLAFDLEDATGISARRFRSATAKLAPRAA